MIRPLLNLAIQVQVLLLADVRRFVNVKASGWPFPKGYRVRIAAAYSAYIFSKCSRAEEYAHQYIKGHGLVGCNIAEQLVHIMRHFDRYLLVDKLTGWINRASTEHLCRRAYGIELAFARCKSTNDWLKPTNAGKDWKSKVDWLAASRVDPDQKEQHNGKRKGQARPVHGRACRRDQHSPGEFDYAPLLAWLLPFRRGSSLLSLLALLVFGFFFCGRLHFCFCPGGRG